MPISEKNKQGVTFAGICRAVCPYYDHESRFSVTCEGPVENTLASIKFTAEKARIRWVEEFCCRYGNGILFAPFASRPKKNTGKRKKELTSCFADAIIAKQSGKRTQKTAKRESGGIGRRARFRF